MVMSSFILGVIAVFLPPLPVIMRRGFSGHLVLNIVLLLLAWIPAILHAWYVILEYDNDGHKKIEKRIARAKQDQARVANLQGASDEKTPLHNQYPAQTSNQYPQHIDQYPTHTNQAGYDRPEPVAQEPVYPNEKS